MLHPRKHWLFMTSVSNNNCFHNIKHLAWYYIKRWSDRIFITTNCPGLSCFIKKPFRRLQEWQQAPRFAKYSIIATFQTKVSKQNTILFGYCLITVSGCYAHDCSHRFCSRLIVSEIGAGAVYLEDDQFRFLPLAAMLSQLHYIYQTNPSADVI